MGILNNYQKYYEEDMNIQQQMEEAQEAFEQTELEKDIIVMIADWSDKFNLPINTELQIAKGKRAVLAYELIEEEFKEFGEASLDEDIVAIQDSLGDLLWVTIRAMMEYGIDPVKCIRAIYKSNMSKIDYTVEDGALTMRKYAQEGIITKLQHNHKKGTFVTVRASDDKVLKSHKFVEPKFEQ